MEPTGATDDTRVATPAARPPVDPKLAAITEQILSMPVDERLRQLEAEAQLFASVRPLD